MQGIADAKNWHEEAREQQISSDQCLRQIVEKPVGGLSTPGFEGKRLEQEIPPTGNAANFSLFEKSLRIVINSTKLRLSGTGRIGICNLFRTGQTF
jgi:hypothetical protein